MPNPNPRQENLKPFQPQGDEPLADKQIQVRLPRDVDAYVRSLPNRSEWLRRVITEAVHQELHKEDLSRGDKKN